jgi:hypothetical protein
VQTALRSSARRPDNQAANGNLVFQVAGTTRIGQSGIVDKNQLEPATEWM